MDILFLHGALASTSQFDQLIATLGSEQVCHSINFSGHGGKIMPLGGLNFETFCNDILSYLDSHKIAKISLFGYSMGGYCALLFASKYPQRVDKIFTLNVKFNWDLESTFKETSFLNPEKMMEKIPGYANNLMLQHGMNIWKDLLHKTSDMMNQLSHNKVLEKEDLVKIIHPCLLGICEKDTTSSLSETMDIRSQLSNASLLVIPKAPHAFEKIPLERLVFEVNHFFNEASQSA